MIDAEIEIRGEKLILLHERAAYWPRERTLLVADAHWGKAAAFRSAGVLVPEGTTVDTLARLDSAMLRTSAARVLFLGDLLHAREGRAPGVLEHLGRWRASHAGVAMVLIRGNHDRGAGDPPAELLIDCRDAPLVETPFAFTHRPGRHVEGYVVAGHIHPAADLSGPAGQRERLPCFWFGPEGAVLPAFGDFTGLADISAQPGDRVFVVAGEEVLPVAMKP